MTYNARGAKKKSHSFSTYLYIFQDLVNIEMFLTAKEVEESLERQETATCLAWCHDNKSRLRKMKVMRLAEPSLKALYNPQCQHAHYGITVERVFCFFHG